MSQQLQLLGLKKAVMAPREAFSSLSPSISLLFLFPLPPLVPTLPPPPLPLTLPPPPPPSTRLDAKWKSRCSGRSNGDILLSHCSHCTTSASTSLAELSHTESPASQSTGFSRGFSSGFTAGSCSSACGRDFFTRNLAIAPSFFTSAWHCSSFTLSLALDLEGGNGEGDWEVGGEGGGY